MKVAFLINGIAKHKEVILSEVRKKCQSLFEYGIYESTYRGHLERMATEVVGKGYDHLISIGGDGTLNEVLNGVVASFEYATRHHEDIEMRYDWKGLSNIKIGMYPAGTGNDFARTTKSKPNIDFITSLITKGQHRLTDIGWSSFRNIEQTNVSERFYINIADIGMGGEAAWRINEKRSSRLLGPRLIYHQAVLHTFFTYKKKAVRCFNDHFEWSGKVMSVVAANGNYFGGGLGIAPHANTTSGQLGVVILGDVSVWDYVKHLRTIQKCQKVVHPEISYYLFDRFSIDSLEQSMPIDMDGELVGYTPVHFCKLREKVAFLQG